MIPAIANRPTMNSQSAIDSNITKQPDGTIRMSLIIDDLALKRTGFLHSGQRMSFSRYSNGRLNLPLQCGHFLATVGVSGGIKGNSSAFKSGMSFMCFLVVLEMWWIFRLWFLGQIFWTDCFLRPTICLIQTYSRHMGNMKNQPHEISENPYPACHSGSGANSWIVNVHAVEQEDRYAGQRDTNRADNPPAKKQPFLCQPDLKRRLFCKFRQSHKWFGFARSRNEKARTRRTLNEAPRSALPKNTPSRAQWGAHSVRLRLENSRFSFSRTAYAKLSDRFNAGRDGKSIATKPVHTKLTLADFPIFIDISKPTLCTLKSHALHWPSRSSNCSPAPIRLVKLMRGIPPFTRKSYQITNFCFSPCAVLKGGSR